MRSIYALIIFCFCIATSGCASPKFVSTMPATYERELGTTINKSYDEVWMAATKFAGESFFSIEHIAKDSNLIVVSYTVDDPEKYIDCGTIQGTNHVGKQWIYKGAERYTIFQQSGNTENFRELTLVCKSNIMIHPEGKNTTSVKINTKYNVIRTVKLIIDGKTHYQNIIEFSFSSQDKGSAPNDFEHMTCTSKGEIEQAIINGIKSKL